MNSNTFANQLWRKHVTFDKLADKKNTEHDKDQSVGRPELRDRHAKRQHKTRHGSDVRDKCDETGDKADEQTEIESSESKCNSVKGAEDKAHAVCPRTKPAIAASTSRANSRTVSRYWIGIQLSTLRIMRCQS